MNFLPVIIFLFLLTNISCDRKRVQSDLLNKSDDNIQEIQDSILYYKCSYSKQSIDTIVQAGDSCHITEIWAINKDDIISLPSIVEITIDTPLLIKKASIHLKKRFSPINVLASDLKIERINDENKFEEKNWFVKIAFLYDRQGYHQIIPMLLGGRIILSNNE